MGPDMGTLPSEYSAAIRSVRTAKSVFWVLMALAIVVQLVAFGLVAWGGVVDPLYAAPAAESQPAATAPTAAGDTAQWWRDMFYWALPVTQFLGVVMGILLSVSLLVGLNVALVGRLGGVASLASAFFWSLLLAALLMPWQYAFADSPFSGALFTYGDLYNHTRQIKVAWGAADSGWLDLAFYHVRFLLYPVLAVLIWLLVDLKFRRGCRKMVVAAAEPLSPQ